MDKRKKTYVAILMIIVVVAALGDNALGGNTTLIQYDNQTVTAAHMSSLFSIANNMTLAKKIGIGAIGTFPVKISGSSLTLGGKPGVLYVGAEFCPYCAATRWSIILAFMRFGNFTGLKYMTSSSTDVYPITPTFTFVNATYTSPFVNFTSRELQTSTGAPLQNLTASESVIYGQYDSGGYPFIDFGNKTVQGGADFSPGVLRGYNWNQIIAQLGNSNSTVTQAIIGGANIYTAQICNIDNFTPASVCSAPYIKEILNLS